MTLDRKDARQIAKDVAVAVDRRRRNRKLLVLGLVAALIVAAVLFFGFGGGFGFGKGEGKGEGKGSGATTAISDAGPARCTVRVTAEGISVDGKLGDQAAAVAACKTAGAADVVVTGDARQGVWDDLRAALDGAGVAIHLKEPRKGSGN
jgi:hypothetical protein